MHNLLALLVLPTTVLSVVVDAQHPQRWPYNLPRDRKYYPEHEEHLRRQEELEARLATAAPVAVRKMSGDVGEKFVLEYWAFDEKMSPSQREWTDPWSPKTSTEEELAQSWNITFMTPPLLAPIQRHSEIGQRSFAHMLPREIFSRDFQCPAGYGSCISIGHPYLCCSTSELCVETSSGVGCCPQGQTCGQSVGSCNTGAGYTSCPDSNNGGCCLPGAECDGPGCVFLGTRTVTTTLPTTTVTTSGSSSTVSAASVPPPSASLSTTTVTVTNSPQGYTTTQTVIVTALPSSGACSTGFFSCPASLGGGCCRDGQACATSHSCEDFSTQITTTITPGPPIRPTSISSSTSTKTTTTTSPTTNEVCPTGYYQCSAYYLGGCCQVGRNCDTTSCPPQDSTTVVTSGVTVVVSGSDATPQPSSCANGWALCPAAEGGGCCPSGYLCAASSCSATVSGEGNTAKMAPSTAVHDVRLAWGFMVFGVLAGVLMIWL